MFLWGTGQHGLFGPSSVSREEKNTPALIYLEDKKAKLTSSSSSAKTENASTLSGISRLSLGIVCVCVSLHISFLLRFTYTFSLFAIRTSHIYPYIGHVKNKNYIYNHYVLYQVIITQQRSLVVDNCIRGVRTIVDNLGTEM